jgi:hypothetical protein
MPFPEFVQRASELFHQVPDIGAGDEILHGALQRSVDNAELTRVYEKVVLVNSLYKTNVYATWPLAVHIHNQHGPLDRLLRDGDTAAVESIRLGHGIRRRNGHERDFFSFATKYACWHNQKAFPIFDERVARLLPDLRDRFHYTREAFGRNHLTNPEDGYANLIAVENQLLNNLIAPYVEIGHLRFKRLDESLWLWARARFNPESLPADALAHLQQVFVEEFPEERVDGTGVWWAD